MEFDHSKDSIAEAIGLKNKHILELGEKLSEIAKDAVMQNDGFKPSQVAEKIAHELSYSELVFVATQYLTEKIQEFELMKKAKVLSMLDEIVQKFKDDEE